MIAQGPTVEQIKAYVTYGLCAFIVVFGMVAIVFLHDDPTAGDTTTILAALVGSAATFLFGQEVQARTARQSQTATAQGVQHGLGNGIHPPEGDVSRGA